MSPSGGGTAIVRGHPSQSTFISHLDECWSSLEMELVTSCSAVKHSTNSANPAFLNLQENKKNPVFSIKRVSQPHFNTIIISFTFQDYKHHSSTRMSRYYPWQTHVEEKRNQMTTTGGEGRYFLTWLLVEGRVFFLQSTAPSQI